MSDGMTKLEFESFDHVNDWNGEWMALVRECLGRVVDKKEPISMEVEGVIRQFITEIDAYLKQKEESK